MRQNVWAKRFMSLLSQRNSKCSLQIPPGVFDQHKVKILCLVKRKLHFKAAFQIEVPP